MTEGREEKVKARGKTIKGIKGAQFLPTASGPSTRSARKPPGVAHSAISPLGLWVPNTPSAKPIPAPIPWPDPSASPECGSVRAGPVVGAAQKNGLGSMSKGGITTGAMPPSSGKQKRGFQQPAWGVLRRGNIKG